MQAAVVVAIVVLWVVLGLGLGWFMGRRGYDAYSWTVMGVVFGPLAVVVAVAKLGRPDPEEPTVLRQGTDRGGTVDVLVGSDGSEESRAARAAADTLFDGRIGRLTLARVVPFGAVRETVALAERGLEQDRSLAAPECSSVLLHGDPADALRDYATRLGYHVIAIGTRGDGAARTMLGSVSKALARGSHVPVLLVDATPQRADPSGENAVAGLRHGSSV